MDEFRIETERLILREWQEEDVEPFMDGLNTPNVTRWLDGMKERSYYDDVVARMRTEQSELGHCFWIVEHKRNRSVLGFCGIRRAEHIGTPVHGKAELGWRLREDAWGRGYAKEAATHSIEWGWRNLDDQELVAYTVPGNSPSWGLMDGLGMRRRIDLDFDHPDFPSDHELCRHITYSISR